MTITSIKNLLLGCLAGFAACATLSGCSDFFDTDPNNIISEKDYIDKDDEVYKGMLGIFNRMQEAGDQAIWLTDLRGSILETTPNAPDALKQIYNYEPTQGNSYADPTCYYAIIIACNDYFYKMDEYRRSVGGMSESDEANFRALISSAVRIKTWAYLMLGRIYGEAYWFDSPLTEMTELSNTEVFTHCDMQQLTDKCINLLDQGVNVAGQTIPANLEVKWSSWLDPENDDQSAYVKWQYLTPHYLLLRAELLSWRASYLSETAAQADWQWIHDNLLKYLYDVHTGAVQVPNFTYSKNDKGEWTESLGLIYQLNIPLSNGSNGDGTYQNYASVFCSDDVIGNANQLVSGIMYDYQNHQRNRLVQYLCPTFPDAESFYVKPSDYGIARYNDDDIRSLTQQMAMATLAGQPAVTKYYYFYNTGGAARKFQYKTDAIYDIEPTIPIFRAHDFHFLLAEAENHLGNFDLANIILNTGMENALPDRSKAQQGIDFPAHWSQYYRSWFGNSGGYGNIGIVGTARGIVYDLPTSPAAAGLTADQLKERYDWALADEHAKEYLAEGKSYSYLCKMAERYSHGGRGAIASACDSVARRIAPKYPTAAQQTKVRSYLSANGYFIQWDLKDK